MNSSERERGGAVGSPLALLWSGLLALVLTGVQISLYAVGSQLAMTAAESGLSSGRRYGVESVEEAEAAALRFLERTGGTVVGSPRAEAVVHPDGSLDVTVTGEIPSLLPLTPLTVDRTATGAIERPAR